MTLLSAWVDDVRAHLDGARNEQANQLDTAYTAGDGVLNLRHPLGGIAAGAVLSIGANTLHVVSVNPLAMTATVIAGFASSTDADAAAGSLVRVNPRFTDHRIIRELGNHLNTLSSPNAGLYAVATQDISLVDGTQGYEVTPATGFQRGLELRRVLTDDATSWVRVPASQWEIQRSAPTDFTSGIAVRVTQLCNETLQLVYAKSFTAITDVAANVSTTGIPGSAEDIPPIGAAINMMSGREVARNAPSAQGDPRRAVEVPPGAIGNSYTGLLRYWVRRTKEESDRLRATYPISK